MRSRTLHTPHNQYTLPAWAAYRLARLLRRYHLPQHGILSDENGCRYLLLSNDLHPDGRGEVFMPGEWLTPSTIRRCWLQDQVPAHPERHFHQRLQRTTNADLQAEAAYLRECRAAGEAITARMIVRGEAGPLPF